MGWGKNILRTEKKKTEEMRQSWIIRVIRLCFSQITVEPVLFLYMLSTFSLYALFQDLVYSRVCTSTYSSTDLCLNLQDPQYATELETVQRLASHWILLSTVSLVIPSILIAIYLGSWSDKFGRKWPVVLPPFGGVMACLVYVYLSFNEDAPVGLICLASMLSGLSGGFVSCIMSCMTYVASISSPENRTVRISRLEAMIFLGGTIGPFLSGSLLGLTGHGFAFIYMMIAYALAFFYAIIFVKEVHQGDQNPRSPPSISTIEQDHLTQEQRTGLLVHPDINSDKSKCQLVHDNLPDVARSAVEEKNKYHSISSECESTGDHSGHEDATSTAPSDNDEHRNIIGRETPTPTISCCSTYFGSHHCLSALKTVLKKREGGNRLYLILTITAAYIAMMITAGELDVAYLFAKGEPLKWSYQIYSYYFGFKYGLGTLVLLLGMPLLQRFQIQDSTISLLGLSSRMAGLILYALSPDTTTAFLVPVVSIFSSFTIPATRSLLSKLVSPDEQGQMFAFVAIMEDLCTMTASVVFNSLYPLTRPIFKGFIFLMAAGLLIIPIIIMWFVGRHLGKINSSTNCSKKFESTKDDQNTELGQENC